MLFKGFLVWMSFEFHWNADVKPSSMFTWPHTQLHFFWLHVFDIFVGKRVIFKLLLETFTWNITCLRIYVHFFKFWFNSCFQLELFFSYLIQNFTWSLELMIFFILIEESPENSRDSNISLFGVFGKCTWSLKFDLNFHLEFHLKLSLIPGETRHLFNPLDLK